MNARLDDLLFSVQDVMNTKVTSNGEKLNESLDNLYVVSFENGLSGRSRHADFGLDAKSLRIRLTYENYISSRFFATKMPK